MTDPRPRRVVIDPGVLISAIITPNGPPAHLLRALRDQRITMVASPKLLDELRVVDLCAATEEGEALIPEWQAAGVDARGQGGVRW